MSRKLNRSLVLGIIRREGPISRVKLAKRSFLSFATVSRVVDFLIGEDFVSEIGKANSVSGRKPVLLQFNEGVGYVIGADVGEEKIQACMANLGGKIIRRIEVSTKVRQGGKVTLGQLQETIYRILSESRSIRRKIKGIGVSVPGHIDEQGRKVISSIIAGWRNISLKETIEAEFGIPCILGNNINLAAIGERTYGIAQMAESLVYIAAGTGVEAGIIVNNEVCYGANGKAGQLSHMAVESNSWQKDYGFRGGLESLINVETVNNRVKQLIEKGQSSIIPDMVKGDLGKLTARMVFTAAGKEDLVATSVVREISYRLGAAIVNIVSLLDPEVIVIGGDIILAGELPLKVVVSVVRKLAPTTPQISLSILGADASIYGSIALVIAEVFKKLELSV